MLSVISSGMFQWIRIKAVASKFSEHKEFVKKKQMQIRNLRNEMEIQYNKQYLPSNNKML